MTEIEDERRFFERESDEEHASRLDDEEQDRLVKEKGR